MTPELVPLRRALRLGRSRASVALVRGPPHRVQDVAALLADEEPSFFASPSAPGLADAPDGALCLVGLDEAGAKWLNLHRNAIGARKLRVVLYGPPGLPLRVLAPDLDSWTRVWIDLPDSAPSWSVERMQVAAAHRVRWLGGDLSAVLATAFPELPRVAVDSADVLRLQPETIDTLRQTTGVLVVEQVDDPWTHWHLHWALAAAAWTGPVVLIDSPNPVDGFTDVTGIPDGWSDAAQRLGCARRAALTGLAPVVPAPAELDGWRATGVAVLDGVAPEDVDWTAPWGELGWPDARSVALTSVALRWPERVDELVGLAQHWGDVVDVPAVHLLSERRRQCHPRGLTPTEKVSWLSSRLDLETDWSPLVEQLHKLTTNPTLSSQARRLALIEFIVHAQDIGLRKLVDESFVLLQELSTGSPDIRETLVRFLYLSFKGRHDECLEETRYQPDYWVNRIGGLTPLVVHLNRYRLAEMGRQGAPVRALRRVSGLLDVTTKHLGPGHILTALIRNNAALLLDEAGRTRSGLKRIREVEAQYSRWHPATSPPMLFLLSNKLGFLFDSGQTRDSVSLYKQLAPLCERLLGTHHAATVIVHSRGVVRHLFTGHLDRAVTAQRRVVAPLESMFGPGNRFYLTERRALARLLADQGQLTEARDHATRAWTTARTHRGPEDRSAISGAVLLAELLHTTKHPFPPHLQDDLEAFLARPPDSLEHGGLTKDHAKLTRLVADGLFDHPPKDDLSGLGSLLRGTKLS